jgi:hypothetical protein
MSALEQSDQDDALDTNDDCEDIVAYPAALDYMTPVSEVDQSGALESESTIAYYMRSIASI